MDCLDPRPSLTPSPQLQNIPSRIHGLEDALNACVAIRGWEAVPYSQSSDSYITTWRWTGRQELVHLCSNAEPSISERLRLGIQCHFEESQLDMHPPVVRAPRGTFETVRSLFLVTILDYTKKPIRALRKDMEDPLFLQEPPPLRQELWSWGGMEVKVVDFEGSTWAEVDVHHLQRYKKALSLDVPSSKISLCRRTYQESIEKDKEILNTYDCVVYMLDVSQLRFHGANMKTELTVVCDILSPEQTFALFVVTDNEQASNEGVVQLFSSCLRKLGGVNGCPLLRLPMKWRMWYSKEMSIDGHDDMFKWISRDVIKRRMERLRGQQEDVEKPH